VAWKFRQEYFEDGDIIEPSDWRINQEEFTSELNGMLDSDNLYQKTFDREFFPTGTFNSLYADVATLDAVWQHAKGTLFEHTQSGWLHENEDGVKLPSVTFNAEEDGLIIVDSTFSAYWPGSDYSSGDNRIDYSYFRPNGVYIRVKSAYVLCVMFRITCNGLSVCQSGPIGNEYNRQSGYLCGSLPVTAGQNVVRMEVRHAWYSPGTDRYIESSAKKPEPEHGAPGVSSANDPTHVRSDVYVNGALFVNHRKR
jgi:hypothetical protein